MQQAYKEEEAGGGARAKGKELGFAIASVEILRRRRDRWWLGAA
jgi:hypothetical protein